MFWIIGVIILAAVIAVFIKKIKPRMKFQTKGNETEDERVYRLVEEKKAKAKELRLPEFMTDLFFNQIIHYPAWMSRDERRFWVPSEVKFAEEITNEPDSKQIKMGISQNVYIFKFESHRMGMPNGSFETRGVLELTLRDKKIFILNIFCEHNQLGAVWLPYDLQAFADGDWIKVFQELRKHIMELGKKRDGERWNSPQKIKKLKDNFNIE